MLIIKLWVFYGCTLVRFIAFGQRFFARTLLIWNQFHWNLKYITNIKGLNIHKNFNCLFYLWTNKLKYFSAKSFVFFNLHLRITIKKKHNSIPNESKAWTLYPCVKNRSSSLSMYFNEVKPGVIVTSWSSLCIERNKWNKQGCRFGLQLDQVGPKWDITGAF